MVIRYASSYETLAARHLASCLGVRWEPVPGVRAIRLLEAVDLETESKLRAPLAYVAKNKIRVQTESDV